MSEAQSRPHHQPTPANPLHGRCYCNAVTYQITAPPFKSVVCHCDLCALRTGSTFANNLWFKDSDFKILTGADKIRRTILGEQGGTRAFCGDCGSPLDIRVWNVELFKDVAILPSGTLESRGEQFPPEMEFFCKRRLGWLGEGFAACGGGGEGAVKEGGTEKAHELMM